MWDKLNGSDHLRLSHKKSNMQKVALNETVRCLLFILIPLTANIFYFVKLFNGCKSYGVDSGGCVSHAMIFARVTFSVGRVTSDGPISYPESGINA